MLRTAKEERETLTMAAYRVHETGNHRDVELFRHHTRKGDEGVIIRAMRL